MSFHRALNQNIVINLYGVSSSLKYILIINLLKRTQTRKLIVTSLASEHFKNNLLFNN